MVLNDRSTEMAETPGLVHVIPAGTFQPTMQDRRFLDIEFSFTENLVREFVEELYNDKGISGRPSHAVLVSDLNDLFGPLGQKFRETVYRFNRYKLMYLGTVIDPVNLKPEALTVFMIHEGYLYGISGKHLELSWETQGGRIRLIEFNEENLTSYINDPNLVPTAKAHLMMVRTHFPNLLEELQSI